jgi:hypothetical protein
MNRTGTNLQRNWEGDGYSPNRLLHFDSKNPDDISFKVNGEYIPVLSYVKASKDRQRKN